MKTHNPFHADLLQRVTMTGDESPGQWNFAADVLRICANHAAKWTHRFDDAQRIPDVLDEAASVLQNAAAEAVNVPHGMAAVIDDYRECLSILNDYVVGGGTLAIRLQTALNGLKSRVAAAESRGL